MHAVYWHCMVAVCENLHWKKSLARSSHMYNCRFQVLRNNRQNLFNFLKFQVILNTSFFHMLLTDKNGLKGHIADIAYLMLPLIIHQKEKGVS